MYLLLTPAADACVQDSPPHSTNRSDLMLDSLFIGQTYLSFIRENLFKLLLMAREYMMDLLDASKAEKIQKTNYCRPTWLEAFDTVSSSTRFSVLHASLNLSLVDSPPGHIGSRLTSSPP